MEAEAQARAANERAEQLAREAIAEAARRREADEAAAERQRTAEEDAAREAAREAVRETQTVANMITDHRTRDMGLVQQATPALRGRAVMAFRAAGGTFESDAPTLEQFHHAGLNIVKAGPYEQNAGRNRDALKLIILARIATRGTFHISAPFKDRDGGRGQTYYVFTDAGLKARRDVANTMTVQRLEQLRRRPSVDRPDWSGMQEHFDAGLLTCLGSGLPVFNPSGATEAQLTAMWHFFRHLAEALNARDPNGDATNQAIASCQALATALRGE